MKLVTFWSRSSAKAYVYIILLTAKAETTDVVEGIMEGADDFLTKPYDRDELRVRVRAGERILELESRLQARNTELMAAKAELEEANAELGWANRRMKRDLDAAARIQRSLLPTTVPATGTLDAAWLFKPCDELAGDIFNIFQIDDEHFGFYLLDVMGHGVQAALLAVTLSRFLVPAPGGSSILFSARPAGSCLRSPQELAMELNRRFPMSDSTGQFFTLLFGILNIRTRELRLVSAGHPGPLYLPKDGLPRMVEAGGFPIGIMEDAVWEETTLVLNPGDRLLVYSDGLLDVENAQGQRLGTRGIYECVRGEYCSVRELIGAIEQQLLRWGQGKPNDDISVLAVAMAGV